MICACVDIGTNTTRVLVAEVKDGRLIEVLQRRAFTRIGMAPEISAEKIAEVARVVAEQVEEARMAFLGATATLAAELPGTVAVVDVGGGSTEIAVGTVAGGVEWSSSFLVGSGVLADRYLRTAPPALAELRAARDHAMEVLATRAFPGADSAVAVGGSAASLRAVVGDALDPPALKHALGILCAGPCTDVAARYALDAERVRLLPAGILILDAAAQRLRRPMQIGRGGLPEGVVLDMART